MVVATVAARARAADRAPASNEPTPATAIPTKLTSDHEVTGGGGICTRDPSACPKQGDIKVLADRSSFGDWGGKPGRLDLHAKRFEIEAAWSVSPTVGAGPHVGVRRYGLDRLGLGLDGTLLWWGNGRTDGAPGWIGAVNLAWVPWGTDRYHRTSDSSLVVGPNVDLYLGGGGAVVARRIGDAPIVPRPALDLFVGLRFFVNRWFAMTLDARGYVTATARPLDLFGTAGVAFFLPNRVIVRRWAGTGRSPPSVW